MPPPNFQKNTQQQRSVQNQTQSQVQQIKKDVSSNDAAHHLQSQQPQIEMALIPETPLDFSEFQPSNGWMNGLHTSDFQIYAVTELPPPPALDLESLSGKSHSSKITSKAEKDVPRLPEPPNHMVAPTEPAASMVDDSVALDRDAFALYFNSSACESPQLSDDNLSGSENPVAISNEENMAALKKLCSGLDDISVKIAEYTPHME